MIYIYFIIYFFNDTSTTENYTLSLHDALPISHAAGDAAGRARVADAGPVRGSGRLPVEVERLPVGLRRLGHGLGAAASDSHPAHARQSQVAGIRAAATRRGARALAPRVATTRTR